MKDKKAIITILILLAAIAVSYGFPRVKYQAPDVVAKLDVPLRTQNWDSINIAEKLDLRNEAYNFIGEIFARAYQNRFGESLFFLILNANNFHNPKICFTGAGYKMQDLQDAEFNANGRTFKAHVLYAGKPNEGLLVVYWICLDKKVVDWTQQKFLQLWYALLNKRKAGLMVRFDIPSSETRIENSLKLAQEFIRDISAKLSPSQAEYLFGK